MGRIARAGCAAVVVAAVSVPGGPSAQAASADYSTAIRACVTGMVDGAARVSVAAHSAIVNNGSCATFAGLEPDVTYIVTAQAGGRCSINGGSRYVRTAPGTTQNVNFQGYCPTSSYGYDSNPYGNNPYYNNPYDRPAPGAYERPPRRDYPHGPPKPPAG